MQLAGEAERQELRRTFDLFDSNHDGSISLQELVEIAAKLGMKQSVEELQEMLQSVDTNGDGKVDFTEFLSLYNEHLNRLVTDEDDDDELREAFRVFDKDQDGYITPAELHSVLLKLGLKDSACKQEVKNMIRSVDIDGDGRVNFQEFKLMMSKTLAMY